MVDMRVVGEAVEPRQEWSSLPPIAADCLPRLEEDLLGQILSLGMAAGPEVHVSVHPLDETVVELAERGGIVGSHDSIDELDDAAVVGAISGLGRLCSRDRQRNTQS